MDLHEVDVSGGPGDAFGEDRLPFGSHLGDEVVGDIGRGLARPDMRGKESRLYRMRGEECGRQGR